MSVEILSPDNQRVRNYIHCFFSGQYPLLVVVGALLFGGDRLSCVEAVGMLSLHGVDAGIATLAPTNENGHGEPSIISLWLDPEAKASSDYRSSAIALFRAVADESVKRYSTPARFVAVTQTELQVAQWAQEEGILFTHIPVLVDLPDW